MTAQEISLAPDEVVIKKTYKDWNLVLINDEVNTFEHVIDCLMKYVPKMTGEEAKKKAMEVHKNGKSVVWSGPGSLENFTNNNFVPRN